jgi:hypothetical protein
MLAKTPAAAIGTHGFVLSMFADCTARVPLAPIFDYTVLTVRTPIANLTVPPDFLVKASLALFAGLSHAAVRTEASSSALLASVTMYSVLTHAGTLTLCTICSAFTMIANAFTMALLALVLDPAVRTRSAFRVALHARKFVFAVLANGAAATWLADSHPCTQRRGFGCAARSHAIRSFCANTEDVEVVLCLKTKRYVTIPSDEPEPPARRVAHTAASP